MELELAPEPGVNQVTIHFVTPTELKAGEGLSTLPTFEPLVARLRDRISNLGQQYGHGPLDLDFRALAAQARTIEMSNVQLHHVAAERQSSRTGQTHPLSGFVGQVTYTGNLDAFLPYLRIGQYTGVGRQTVWGKGELRLEI